MFRTLGIGYVPISVVALSGFLLVGGPVWAWMLAVWLGGAVVTLLAALAQASRTETPGSQLKLTLREGSMPARIPVPVRHAP